MLSAAAICCALLSAGVVFGDESSKKDSEKLQGKWGWLLQMASMNHPAPELSNLIHGRELDKGESLLGEMKFTVEVKGDSFTFSDHKKKTRQATIKLDASKQPREIDLVIGDGKPFLGIYKIEGDTLTLYIGDQKQRPTEFPRYFRPKEGQVIISYTREKK
jgi:uncharacterized protein (TIGR03067 family)